MANFPQSKTDMLKSLKGQLLKEYIAYDAGSRKEYVYQAPVDVGDGEPCLVTQFVYDGVSNRAIKRKEYYDVWQSAWDV